VWLKHTRLSASMVRARQPKKKPVRGDSPPFFESLEKIDTADPDSSTVLVARLSTLVHEKPAHDGTTVAAAMSSTRLHEIRTARTRCDAGVALHVMFFLDCRFGLFTCCVFRVLEYYTRTSVHLASDAAHGTSIHRYCIQFAPRTLRM